MSRHKGWMLPALAWLGLCCGCGRPAERKVEQALREIAAGREVRAQALLEKAIAARPGSEANAAAYNQLGIVYYRLGRLEEAMEAFEESRRLAPEDAAPVFNLGALAYLGGDPFRAVVLMKEAAMTDPADPRPLEFLASMHRRAAAWDQAEEALAEAAIRAPLSPRILTAQGVVDLRTGRVEQAVERWHKALERQPEYPPALYNLALYHEEHAGRPETADGFFSAFLETVGEGARAARARQALAEAPPAEAPPPAPPREVPPPEPPAADAREAAGNAFDRGETQRALNLYLQAADEARRDGDPERREQILEEAARRCFEQARAHMAYGQFLLEEDRPQDAVAAFKKAAVLAPRSVHSQYALAEAALAADETDAALVALRETVDIDPQHADARWELALLLEGPLNRPAQAAREFEAFRRRFPEDSRVLEAARRLPEPPAAPSSPPPRSPTGGEEPPPAQPAPQSPAVETQSRVRIPFRPPSIRQTDLAAQAFNRGVAHQQRGDWDSAIYYYLRALENDDTFTAAFYNLGAVYRETGRLDLAGEAYRRGLVLQPDHVNARYNLALLYWETQAFEAAEREALVVVRAAPDHAQAHLLLGLLYARRPETVAQARRHYNQFLRLEPESPQAPNVRRWLQEQRP